MTPLAKPSHSSTPKVKQERCLDKRPILDTAVRNIREVSETLFRKVFAFRIRVRKRLSAIFFRSELHGDYARGSRLASCGRSQLVFQSTDNAALLLPYACGQRVCPTCSRQKSLDRWMTVVSAFAARPTLIGLNLRWITLTLVSPAWGDLAIATASMLKAFGQLRRSDAWKSHVRGTIWNLEVTINRRKKTWHPHIHVLYDGDFWHWRDAKQTWRNHCRARGLIGNLNLGQAYHLVDGVKTKPTSAASLEQVLREVTKYNLKPFDSLDTPASCIVELVHALHNKRTWGTSGTLAIPAQIRPEAKRWFLLGGLGKLLDDRQSELWTDETFGAALIARAAAVSGSELLDLVDTYPTLAHILGPPEWFDPQKSS